MTTALPETADLVQEAEYAEAHVGAAGPSSAEAKLAFDAQKADPDN